MPTYDYICQSCGHELEAFQRISEKPLKKCPECGKQKLERQIGAGAGLIFRGSGFYITDYRSSDYQSKAEAESKSSKDSASKDSGSKDSASKESGSKDGAAKSAKKESSSGDSGASSKPQSKGAAAATK